MALSFDSLLKNMVNAAKESLGEHWLDIKDVAITSFKSLTLNLIEIEKMRNSGTITEEKAALLIGMQKDAVKIAIATEKGLSLLAAEAALNAALDVVRKTVNRAIGFAIL
jgi:hypothetical protein